MGQKQAGRQAVESGNTALGIELGSTRIKAVLIDAEHRPIASGGYDWENQLENGLWTYPLSEVWKGLQGCFAELQANVQAQYGVPLATVGAMGVSAMMHGYLAFDKDENLLAPFRTWRNTITGAAASKLTELFGFNIPQRWSVAHLYQAVLNDEAHVPRIASLNTLAGYVHYKLTGQKVLGVGDASGMFPIDSSANDYQAGMLDAFDKLVAGKNYSWRVRGLLPKVLAAGQAAGHLSAEGAKLLDASGTFGPGVPLCPPEGDAATGMVATNSVAQRTGNVSAGTSIFAMVVLEKPLSRLYKEIDMVTTPTGRPVAMVHCNNCTTDLDAWAKVFMELAGTLGAKVTKPQLYDAMYFKALEGDADAGGLLSYNYYSGEHLTGFEQGCPLLVRGPESRFTLANLMRTLLFSTMGTLRIGMNTLTVQEKVKLNQLLGHGGLFKTKGVGQKLMAGALGVPVAVMESAGEGGAWGIALLADFLIHKKDGQTLDSYLAEQVFAGAAGECATPDDMDVEGFNAFMQRYTEGLAIERAAVEHLKR